MSTRPSEAAKHPGNSPGQRYRWLLFDADGTLFDYERAEISALSSAFEQIGVAFDVGCLSTYQRINQDLWKALEKGLITPEKLKVRRFEQLFEALGVRHPAAPFAENYLQCLANCSDLVDGAHDVVLALKPKYRMAIVTNGLSAVQRPRLARSSIRDCVAEIIISEEIGYAKPATEFFDVTFARLGHPSRSEVLMIGDNWSSDIQGAAFYGIDACWYNPNRSPRPAAPPITSEITSLHELLPLL
jgi:YjjG family noncanonical pyrimidine nucleotidase